MVADRAGTSGSCQALLMMMRVASPVGRRIGDGGGQMQHAGFEQVGFHFVPVDIGQHVPVDFDTRRKALPALFEHLSVVEQIVDNIAIFVGQIVIFQKWRGRPCSSRSLVPSTQ